MFSTIHLPLVLCGITILQVFALDFSYNPINSFQQTNDDDDILFNTTRNTILDVETLLNGIKNEMTIIRDKRWVRKPTSNNNNCIQLELQENRRKHIKIEDNINMPIEMKVQLQNCKLKPKHPIEKSLHHNFKDSNSHVTHYRGSHFHDRNIHHSNHHPKHISHTKSEEMHLHHKHHGKNHHVTSSSSFETYIQPPHFHPPQNKPPYFHHDHHNHNHGNKKQCSKSHDSSSSETSKESSKSSDDKIHCKGTTDKLLEDFKFKMDHYDKIVNLYKNKYEEIFNAYSSLKLTNEKNLVEKNKFEMESKNLSISLLTCNINSMTCKNEKTELNTTIENLKQTITKWSSKIVKYRIKFKDLTKLVNFYKNKVKLLEAQLKTCNNNENELLAKIKELTDKVTNLIADKLNYAKLLVDCQNSGLECQKNVAKLTDDLLKCKKDAATTLVPDTDPLLDEDGLDREFVIDFLVPTGPSGNLQTSGNTGPVPSVTVASDPSLSLSSAPGGGAGGSGSGSGSGNGSSTGSGSGSGSGGSGTFNAAEYCINKANGILLQKVSQGSSNSNYYYISPDTVKATFIDAKSACLRYNMYLACIGNYEEYLALQSALSVAGGSEFWIGHYLKTGTQNSNYVCDADILLDPVYSSVQQNDLSNPCVTLTYQNVFSTQQNQDCKLTKRYICELREICMPAFD